MQCFSVLQSGVGSRTFKDYQGACEPLQSRSPLIRTNEEAMENVHIKRVEFKLNVRAFFGSPGTKQTVRNK